MDIEGKTTLVVMAAGMGSRFGGLKQIEPIGPKGEIIIDYSTYDAIQAGFSKVVFIIKKAIEHDFREAAGKRIEKMADVEYVFQELDKIPSGFSIPEGREKPWGTGHAILCARDAIKTPFVVINADDYYGKSAYSLIHDYLVKNNSTCMVGYKLGNTLSENGTVKRGICQVDNENNLVSVVETFSLDKNSPYPMDSTVSMNMWGFNTGIFDEFETHFKKFLTDMEDPIKGEFLIPCIVDDMIKTKNEKVKVLTTEDKWYGVTYREDVDAVKTAIKDLVSKGLYENL